MDVCTIVPYRANFVTSVLKAVPEVAPKISYRTDDALSLLALALALAVLALAVDPNWGASQALPGMRALFVRPTMPRGHRPREF